MESGSGGEEKVKISVYTKNISPESGGSFSFTSGIINQLSNELVENIKIYGNKIRRCVLMDLWNRLNRPHFLEKMIYLNTLEFLTRFDGSDYVYFPSIHFVPVTKPYIFTVWDLCHLDFPEMPEIKEDFFNFERRENHYKLVLKGASLVVTGTDHSKKKIIDHYGVKTEKVVVIPFPVRDEFFNYGSRKKRSDDEEKYLFYPAQFWKHKNHDIVIEALSILRNHQNFSLKVVFTGSDKGSLSYIKKLVEKRELRDQVDFRGFVPFEELIDLYDNASALVFPSFFGPDNIPPLEAMARGCPVLYSDIEGARDFYRGSVEFFNPEDPKDLADKIFRLVTNIEKSETIRKIAYDFVKDKRCEKYVSTLLGNIKTK